MARILQLGPRIPHHVFLPSETQHWSPSRRRKSDSGDRTMAKALYCMPRSYSRSQVKLHAWKFFPSILNLIFIGTKSPLPIFLNMYGYLDSTTQARIPAPPRDPLSNTQRSYPIPNQSQVPHLRALPKERASLKIGSLRGIYSTATP